MRTLIVSAVALTTLASGRARAQAPDQYVDGVVNYTWSGAAKPEPTPAAACQDGIKVLAKQGNKQTYVGVKDGPADGAETCILQGADHKTWNQTNVVVKSLVCPPTTSVASVHNVGTFASEKCHCDAPTGCPAVAAPAPAPAPPPAVAPAPASLCQAKSDPNRAPISIADAAKQSAANQKLMTSTPDGKAIKAKYDRAKSDVRDQEGGFPEFGEPEMCNQVPKGTPTDVNIGSLCGNRQQDFNAANAAAGLKCRPKGCTWHHHEDLGRMQLVNTADHAKSKLDDDELGVRGHYGGSGIWNRAFCSDADRKSPTFNPATCRYSSGGSGPDDVCP